jgi:hypothetical protein
LQQAKPENNPEEVKAVDGETKTAAGLDGKAKGLQSPSTGLANMRNGGQFQKHAVVKPHVLTHVIDGFIILEGK